MCYSRAGWDLFPPSKKTPPARYAGGRGYTVNQSIRYAISYVNLGYRVLPLAPGEKRPHGGLVPHGLREASQDLEVIRAWWRSCPECGVGIVAPEPVLVLDVDEPGVWDALRWDYPALEAAPRQRTPKGGVHVFLRLPEGVRLSATTRALEGVDLRGMGRAYVVAAPTRLADGRGYSWEVPLVRPARLPQIPEGLLLKLLPPPPPPREVVVEAGSSPRRLRALLEAYADRVAAAPEGTRHNTLIRYAVATGGLIPHGLDPQEAEEALVGAAMRAGLPEREARDAARWGLKVGQGAPLNLGEGFTANGGVFRKGVCGKPEPFSSQKSVFRKTATYGAGVLRKRGGVL
jgi:hypothetical protein